MQGAQDATVCSNTVHVGARVYDLLTVSGSDFRRHAEIKLKR